eukprot:353077-Chlamydomonas_euryale.AAC.3
MCTCSVPRTVSDAIAGPAGRNRGTQTLRTTAGNDGAATTRGADAGMTRANSWYGWVTVALPVAGAHSALELCVSSERNPFSDRLGMR